jgi:hypothetical protein
MPSKVELGASTVCSLFKKKLFHWIYPWMGEVRRFDNHFCSNLILKPLCLSFSPVKSVCLSFFADYDAQEGLMGIF